MPIIQTHNRKTADFGQIVWYIHDDKGLMVENTEFLPVYHNVPIASPENAIQAFYDAEQGRKINRKDSNRIHHDIISFHPDESPTADELDAISREYIKLRMGERPGIAFARPHVTTRCKHIHVMTSGVCLRGYSMRLSNSQYMTVRRNLERYILKTYPHLNKSIVYLNKRELKRLSPEASRKGKSKTKLRAMENRNGHKEPLRKRAIAQAVETCICRSANYASFQAALKAKGFRDYTRGGKLYGIIDSQGKKYRFSTLGLESEMLKHIRQDHLTHLKYLETLQRIPQRSREREPPER